MTTRALFWTLLTSFILGMTILASRTVRTGGARAVLPLPLNPTSPLVGMPGDILCEDPYTFEAVVAHPGERCDEHGFLIRDGRTGRPWKSDAGCEPIFTNTGTGVFYPCGEPKMTETFAMYADGFVRYRTCLAIDGHTVEETCVDHTRGGDAAADHGPWTAAGGGVPSFHPQ